MTLLRGLNARELPGVKLVASDAHSGLVAAMRATLDGAAWQRCRTHHAARLMSASFGLSLPGGVELAHVDLGASQLTWG